MEICIQLGVFIGYLIFFNLEIKEAVIMLAISIHVYMLMNNSAIVQKPLMVKVLHDSILTGIMKITLEIAQRSPSSLGFIDFE